jgi:hypothetical protein
VNTSHAFDSLENTLKILNVQRKGPHRNTLEKNHIYKTKETGRLLNEVMWTSVAQNLSCWFEERGDDCGPTRDLSSADPPAPLADVGQSASSSTFTATVPVG